MGPSGPAGKVRSFYSALNNGNLQKAEGMIHPQSPMAGSFESNGFGGEMLNSADITVQSTNVVSETETRATVKTKVKISLSGFGEETSTGNVELRKHNGEWMLYSESTL